MKEELKKGDYVVVISNNKGTSSCIKMINKIYQLLQNSNGGWVNCDTKNGGETFYNGNGGYNIDKECVRLATPQEIAEYERLGKSFDVTTLSTESTYEIY